MSFDNGFIVIENFQLITKSFPETCVRYEHILTYQVSSIKNDDSSILIYFH